MTERPQDQPGREDDRLLEPFFAAARAQPEAALPDALSGRLLHDALSQLPAPTRPQPPSRPLAGFRGWFAGLGDQAGRLLGGAPGVAMVCVAGLAGVWIGVAVPGSAEGLAAYILPGAASLVQGGEGWAEAAQYLGEDDALLALLDSF